MHIVLGMGAVNALFPLLARLSPHGSRELADRVTQRWMQRLCALLRLRIDVEGTVSRGPVLYVANHISWLDIVCLRSVLDADFVAKHDVLDWPAIGRMAQRVGTIFLERGGREAASLAADDMTWTLQRGRSLIVFPEGTTTDGRGVRPFHARLYQAAIRTHTAVQAIALGYPHRRGVHPAAPFVGDDNLARHLWALLGEDAVTVTLHFCPPLASSPAISRRELAQRSREQIVAVALAPALPASRPDRRQVGGG